MADLLVGLSVWATVYAGQYVGQPLAFGGTYTYTTPAWVAVPMDGAYEPFDLLAIWGVDKNGEPWFYMGRVMDTGPLSLYCIETPTSCDPIAFDIPAIYAPFPGLSARVTEAWNISAEARRVH